MQSTTLVVNEGNKNLFVSPWVLYCQLCGAQGKVAGVGSDGGIISQYDFVVPALRCGRTPISGRKSRMPGIAQVPDGFVGVSQRIDRNRVIFAGGTAQEQGSGLALRRWSVMERIVAWSAGTAVHMLALVRLVLGANFLPKDSFAAHESPRSAMSQPVPVVGESPKWMISRDPTAQRKPSTYPVTDRRTQDDAGIR